MTGRAAAQMLPDGRLHLHHGPIDLILSVEGPDRDAALQAASTRFEHVLDELVAELPALTASYDGAEFEGPIARAMARAVAPLAVDRFVTPMAAVAGAVADDIIASLDGFDLRKAVANNGGDIALFLKGDATFQAASPTGGVTITAASGLRGVATSGWRGRSQSRGIADAVTVLAQTAARADAAATLIANAVDLPGHRAITRRPAHQIEAVPQLKDIEVTVEVGPLTPEDVDAALSRGATYAQQLVDAGLIAQAALLLNGETRIIGSADSATALPVDRS